MPTNKKPVMVYLTDTQLAFLENYCLERSLTRKFKGKDTPSLASGISEMINGLMDAESQNDLDSIIKRLEALERYSHTHNAPSPPRIL